MAQALEGGRVRERVGGGSASANLSRTKLEVNKSGHTGQRKTGHSNARDTQRRPSVSGSGDRAKQKLRSFHDVVAKVRALVSDMLQKWESAGFK